jgi:hypothetical protein
LKFTKKTTIEQIVKRFTEVGYYLPYQRIKNHVKYSIYTEAITQLRLNGISNARDYFALQVAALKEQEKELYSMAAHYGEV